MEIGGKEARAHMERPVRKLQVVKDRGAQTEAGKEERKGIGVFSAVSGHNRHPINRRWLLPLSPPLEIPALYFMLQWREQILRD